MIFQVLNEDGTAYNPLERLSPLTPEQEDRVREIVKEELDKIRIDIAKQSKLPILDSDLQNIKGW